MSFLNIEQLEKSYEPEEVLSNVSFSVREGKTLSILGKSGSGKTTLLKIIAGLTKADCGSIFVQGEEISHKEAEERDVIYLFQDATLFPHFSVYENIAFGLRVRDYEEEEIERRVNEMIDRLKLESARDRLPHQLSGGQQQRAAFGRALVCNPSVLLLDEPFASLDVSTRDRMQKLFKQTVHEFNITSLFVTHNLKEAIIMGDSIAHLKNGDLSTYNSIEAFVRDPDSGVKQEMQFWESLHQKNRTRYQ